MGSNPLPLFPNLFLIIHESKCLKSIKKSNFEVARALGIIFRFFGDLITINNVNEC